MTIITPNKEIVPLQKILDTNVSFFESVGSSNANDVKIGEVLSSFRTKKYASVITKARIALNEGNEQDYKTLKKKLPVVAFCGTFNGGHKKTDLVEYSNVMVLDIDDLTQDDLIKVKKQLATENYVFAFWESPSKQGFKGLVYLQYDYDVDDLDSKHKNAFGQLKDYFDQEYDITLDRSGLDYSRLCFACWDPTLVIKDLVTPFHVTAPIEKNRNKASRQHIKRSPIVLSGVPNMKGRNSYAKRTEMESIIRYLRKHNKSITRSYQDWLEVAFGIVSTFNPDLGKKYFLQLCRLDHDKFDETECMNLLNNCYRKSNGVVNFATIIYKAQQQGYKKV